MENINYETIFYPKKNKSFKNIFKVIFSTKVVSFKVMKKSIYDDIVEKAIIVLTMTLKLFLNQKMFIKKIVK